MSKLPATARSLRASAYALRRDADALASGNGSRLLRFYGVECAIKERYIVSELASPRADTSALDGTDGDFGHDLDKGLKAIRAPGTLQPAPQLKSNGKQVAIGKAHELWRYGIPHEGEQAAEAWLKHIESWLEDSR